MKINVGVVGIGNLGNAVIKEILKHKEFNLVAAFSRRKLKNTTPYNQILNFKKKIDLLFLCTGSQSDLESQASFLIKHFNTIDCYDNHAKLNTHIKTINKLAKENRKIALCSFGWDPGLFSYMRGLFLSLGFTPYSFWGKGTSQGHTQAIKQINGVIDAIQFTVPNTEAINKIKSGKLIKNSNFHFRECFVVCKKEDEERIKETILNMPNYFKNCLTQVNFISLEELNKIKSFSHQGEIVTQNNIMNFSLKLPSNPEFTAKVLVTYAKSFTSLKNKQKFGAHTIFDIPLNYIINEKKFTIL